MKRLIILFLLTSSLLNASIFWNKPKKQVLTVESIISYSPSIVNYVYREYNIFNVMPDLERLKQNNNIDYYYTDCIQLTHMFNFYPVFQIGAIVKYTWLWGLQTFVLSNYYRVLGFNFDLYNLSFQVSLFDLGFSWYKYKWNTNYNRNNQLSLLVAPITAGINYRIRLNKCSDIFLSLGYSLQTIYMNNIDLPLSKRKASLIWDNQFNMGIGFRFYTKDFN